MVGAGLVLWLLAAARRRGLREALGYRPLALALLSVAVTLASGPIDNAWHLAFGRDAVIWSPPHVFGILGTAGLGVALLAELSRRPGRFAMLLRPLVGGLVLAAFNFLVIEYEADVPQFDPLWYLPVLSGLAAFALGLIQLIDGQRFAAGKAAAAHLGFVAAVAALLLALGYDAPELPLLLGPALVLDVPAGRLPLLGRALLFELVLFGLYVLNFDALGSGVRIDSVDVAAGFPIGLALTTVVLLALRVDQGVRLSGGRTATATGLLLLLALLVVPSSALAHDPGQGPDRGTMTLVAESRGHELSLRARPSRCQDLRGGQLVARRAGQELRAPLVERGCRFRGRLRVSGDGRWLSMPTCDAERGRSSPGCRSRLATGRTRPAGATATPISASNEAAALPSWSAAWSFTGWPWPSWSDWD